jgi:hypothetical protein
MYAKLNANQNTSTGIKKDSQQQKQHGEKDTTTIGKNATKLILS